MVYNDFVGMSPMMQKWQSVKAEHSDCLVFFRLGDFYEMFFDDAKTASKVLGLTLTGRDCGLTERAPMCGVPMHTVNAYVKKLVEKGFRVAICEQLSAPQKGKQMVDRAVTRVITAGTFDDENFLDAGKNNFIAAVYTSGEAAAIAWCDITTGEFYAINTTAKNLENVKNMINPREIIDSNGHYAYAFNSSTAYGTIMRYFNITNLKVFDLEKDDKIVNCSGALLHYITNTQKVNMQNITKISVVKNGEFLIMDKTARDNLEILHEFRNPGQKHGSLLWIVDETQTPMGAREMARVLSQPLYDVKKINARFDAVADLQNDGGVLKNLRGALGEIADIARLSGRAANGNIAPRDFIALRNSLENIGRLKQILFDCTAAELRELDAKLGTCPDLCDLITRAVVDSPPAKTDEGGFIRGGFNTKLDEYRSSEKYGREWLLKLEQTERDETKIRELKIAFNRIVGYFFEVPTRLAASVPYRFTRKGSTVNTERYTTQELKVIEDKILHGQENAVALEQKILGDLRAVVLKNVSQIIASARAVAVIDVIQSFAFVSQKHGFVRPVINTSGKLNLKNARHPVVERLVGVQNFIANDAELNNSTMLITGPNMAGKSTFMRMVAANVILAHAGCFVPATCAEIPLTDRIFTRIGASDNLTAGESTFMVEMNEVSNIVHNATPKSLILLDEVGRGTGTTDGLALASAIVTFITNKIRANTMFATHFHELTAVANDNPKIKNYKVLTEQAGGEIVFLHKVAEGIEQNSFGIDVARLSGLPNEIIDNARRLLK